MKVRSDAHSTYIRQGGYVFRPLHKCPETRQGLHGGGGRFALGDEVTARHAGGPTVRVKRRKDGRTETWYSHGAYSGKKTTECWIEGKD